MKEENALNGIREYHPEVQESDIQRKHRFTMPEIRHGFISSRFRSERYLKSFVAFDTETTGLNPERDRIIQLSALRYVNGKPEEMWNTYINPQRKISAGASAVNGITDEMVSDCPVFSQYAESFQKFVGKDHLVGYNVDFDLSFLWCSGLDLIHGHVIYDCMLTAYGALPKGTLPNRKLTTLAAYYGIDFNAHDSLGDTYATAEVFLKVIETITGKK